MFARVVPSPLLWMTHGCSPSARIWGRRRMSGPCQSEDQVGGYGGRASGFIWDGEPLRHSCDVKQCNNKCMFVHPRRAGCVQHCSATCTHAVRWMQRSRPWTVQGAGKPSVLTIVRSWQESLAQLCCEPQQRLHLMSRCCKSSQRASARRHRGTFRSSMSIYSMSVWSSDSSAICLWR